MKSCYICNNNNGGESAPKDTTMYSYYLTDASTGRNELTGHTIGSFKEAMRAAVAAGRRVGGIRTRMLGSSRAILWIENYENGKFSREG